MHVRFAVAMVIALVGSAAGTAAAAQLLLLCGVATSWSVESCRASAERFEMATGHDVRIVTAPSAGTLDLLQALFAVRSDRLDVVQLDVVWPAVLAPHLADLGATARRIADPIEAARSAGHVDGRHVALPLYVDVGALFYRRDLLESYGLSPPSTWNDVRQSAGRIVGAEQEAGRSLDGLLFQGRVDEGLTCNVIEWVASVGAPPLVNDGTIDVRTPAFEAMLTRAATWIGETSPRSNLEATEVETLERFAAGQALFMRHWASAAGRLATLAPEIAQVTELTAVAAVREELRAGTMGGSMVGVSAYTREPEAARALAAHLASGEEQRLRAREDGLLPAARALFADAALREDWPLLVQAEDLLERGIQRPALELGAGYGVFSREVAATVHAILAGELDAAEGLEKLQRRLERLSGGGRRW